MYASLRRVPAAVLTLLATGCVGAIGGGDSGDSPAPGMNPPQTTTGAPADPGRVGIHRLNNLEYNNTARDLLGTSSTPAQNFLAEEAAGFDNIASALGMTAAQFEAYYNAARGLRDEVFANPSLMARLGTCTPSVANDPCASQIISELGGRIYRRPLSAEEVSRALGLYNEDFARSADPIAAIGEVLRGMLSSAGFLYRIEFDPSPASLATHALTGFELASRLSFLHWSSMPDSELFGLAQSGALADRATLEAQVDRMLADPKAKSFVESFGGQWLDMRDMIGHGVTPEVFPSFSEPLRNAMMTEGYLWFSEFLTQDRNIGDWFKADFNYVNDTLAQHYGFPAPGSGEEFVRVEVTADERRGFLGLGQFLTRTSFPSRTSPTLRAVWVLSNLLCDEPPQPPPDIPELDDPNAQNAAAGIENVRDRLSVHRSDPKCAACHNMLDPIGLAFEHFDGIGQYRTQYGNGDPVDASGTLPDGRSVNGLVEMSDTLSEDPRFSACGTEKVFTYAHGRWPEDSDEPYLEQIHDGWTARGLTMRNLIKEVVVNDTFRFRRGE